MLFQTKNLFFTGPLNYVDYVKNKKHFLKIGGFLGFFGFSILTEVYAIEQEKHKKARSIINGVISLYRKEVEIGGVEEYNIYIQEYKNQINDSYLFTGCKIF